MKRTLLYAFVAFFAVIGIFIFIYKYNVKRQIDEYNARVASKVVMIDSVSLQRTLLDTSYIENYSKLNDSNIEKYIDDWYMASKDHQSKNKDTSLTMLYNKVINYCHKKMTVLDSLYDDNVDFSKGSIADTSEFYVVPENVCIHKLQTRKKEKEWYRHINVFSDTIYYDVPVIDNGKPVLYLSDADDTILSNYLSWKYEWRGDTYYEERNIEKEKILCKYVPVREGGELPGHYRFYSAPIISNIYHYYGDIMFDIRLSAYYMETLLLKEENEDFEVVYIYQ